MFSTHSKSPEGPAGASRPPRRGMQLVMPSPRGSEVSEKTIIFVLFLLLFCVSFWPKLNPEALETGQARKMMQNKPKTSPVHRF